MKFAIQKTGNKFAVHNAAEDGTPSGVAINIADSHPEALKFAPGAKCYDEYGMEYAYVPWTAVTLAEALEAQEAQEYSREVSTVARMYKQLVDRVLDNGEVKDKGAKIVQLATDFAAWLEKSSKIPEAKAVEIPAQIDYSIIKSLPNDRIGSYAVLWGDETKRDLDKQYFTVKTAELTTIFDTVGRLPFIYHHTLDGQVKTRVAGVVDVLKADSVGLWYEAQLKKADEYDDYIKKLIASGKLKTSSQTFPMAMEWDHKTGEITRWPIVEISGTPTPAEYRMPAIEILKTAYAEIGADSHTLDQYQQEPQVEQGAEKARLALELATLELI